MKGLLRGFIKVDPKNACAFLCGVVAANTLSPNEKFVTGLKEVRNKISDNVPW